MWGGATRRSLIGLAAAALALALSAAASPARASAQPALPGISVYGQGPTTLATFRTVRCAIRPTRNNRREFTAIGRSGAWSLYIGLSPFSGYRDHTIPWGNERDDAAYFSVRGPQGFFSPQAKPAGATLPPSGGAVVPRRSSVGLHFIQAWNSDITAAVAVAGVARCNAPRRRR